MFQPIAYIEWISGRPEAAAYDLGSSDLQVPQGDGVVPPTLDGLDDPPADTTGEQLVADRYDVAPEHVALTAGTTHANVLVAATALADATGDPRVLVERPGYEPHRATPASIGADVWRFRRDAGWLDPDRVANAIDGTVDLVTLSNRHNPTGRLADRATLAAVAEVCADADATLLVDEVYAPYGVGAGDGPFGGPTAAGLPNTVVTSSVTKFFGLGPLRFGWVVADEAFLGRLMHAFCHLPDLASPSRRLGARALFNADALADTAHGRCRENHALLAEFVADRPALDGTVPTGCPYAFLRHHEADGDAVSELAWERGLLVVPGRFFGVDGGFRVSLGGEPGAMAEALAVLDEVLDDL